MGRKAKKLKGKKIDSVLSPNGDLDQPEDLDEVERLRLTHWAYGAWQMDNYAKTPDHFVNSIKDSAPYTYARLAPLLGSTGMGKQGALGHSPALQEEEFSTAVHFVVGGANRLIKRADLGHGSDTAFLEHLYAEKERATGGRFHNRYEREKNDVMAALLQDIR